MRKPRVWILSPFSDPFSPESADRYRYICQALTDQGAEVCQFVSSFDHGLKRRRKVPTLSWRCIGIFEPGYQRNVSVRRLLSHTVFDLAVGCVFLQEMVRGGPPDVIFSALPHNGAACVAGFLAKLCRARFIVDIHDTWPESVLGVARLHGPMWLAYYAWKGLADVAILLADDIFGESQGYVERANRVRRLFSRSEGQLIYIGGDIDYYQEIAPSDQLPDMARRASFLVAYVGTLGANYDLDCVIDAFEVFGRENPEAALLFLGAGEREEELRSRISELGLRAWVSGRVPHRILISYLKHAHVGLNCFAHGGNVAYSYKLNDYLLTGVPIINSLEGESADIIAEEGLGEQYKAGDSASLLMGLRRVQSHWSENPAWGERVLGFSRKNLNRGQAYKPLIEKILNKNFD